MRTKRRNGLTLGSPRCIDFPKRIRIIVHNKRTELVLYATLNSTSKKMMIDNNIFIN